MLRGLGLNEPKRPNVQDPRVREWIDEEYRRITTVPIGKQAAPSAQSITPGLTRPSDETHEGIVDRADTATNEAFYECPSCGRRIYRHDTLRREWGNQVVHLSPHPKLAEAAAVVWAFDVENFKAFHQCESVPSRDEIAREWPKLAALKLLRYTVSGWLGVLLIGWLTNRDLTVGDVFLSFLVIAGLFTFVVPLTLALSFPFLNAEMREVWSQGILSEWSDWKLELVVRNRERRRWKSLAPNSLNQPLSASTPSLQQREQARTSRQRSATDQETDGPQQAVAYATMWERLKAYVCDFAVIFLVLGTFILSGLPLPNSAGAGTALFVAYMTLSQSIFHTTVGKYLLGLELRSASRNRRYPSFWALLSRETGGRLVSMLFFCAGYWLAIGRPQNQAWSDRIAGTVVVKRNTTVRLRRFLKALVVVSLLFTICFYLERIS